MLKIQARTDGDTLIFGLEGRIDTNTAPELDKELKDKLPDAEKLILDFENVDYISSAGLRVLMAADKIMRRAGGMKIINVNDVVEEVFEVTGFSNVFTVE